MSLRRFQGTLRKVRAALGRDLHALPRLPTFESGGALVDVSDRDALYDLFDREKRLYGETG